jgi:S-adenosylmethionine synthetase
VFGGPAADTGLTGRKIIVDTYGGYGSHGGGAFSGKDPSKVDRTASYAARHAAKNVVAARLADRCEVQLAYAIGVAEPVSILVDCQGTARIPAAKISDLLQEHLDFRPKPMIERLKLRRPIYKDTCRHGHFGWERPEYTWELRDLADTLRKAAGL